jgi:hypothetical protein
MVAAVASCSSSSSAAAAATSVPRLSSPLHNWYQQLASSYAAVAGSTSGISSKLRFLSLQSDSPRAKALCRRLGVSEGLSVLLVAPSTGRKVLELCGTKIEQDLPAGEAEGPVGCLTSLGKPLDCCCCCWWW